VCYLEAVSIALLNLPGDEASVAVLCGIFETHQTARVLHGQLIRVIDSCMLSAEMFFHSSEESPVVAVVSECIPYGLGRAELSEVDVIDTCPHEIFGKSAFGKTLLAGERNLSHVHETIDVPGAQAGYETVNIAPFIAKCI
jgi:hypothetical protein